MKSNRGHTDLRTDINRNLHLALSKEKETLVSMFLASASHNELTEQIRKINALCSRIDKKQPNRIPD